MFTSFLHFFLLKRGAPTCQKSVGLMLVALRQEEMYGMPRTYPVSNRYARCFRNPVCHLICLIFPVLSSSSFSNFRDYFSPAFLSLSSSTPLFVSFHLPCLRLPMSIVLRSLLSPTYPSTSISLCIDTHNHPLSRFWNLKPAQSYSSPTFSAITTSK